MMRTSEKTALLCVVCMGGDPRGPQHRCDKCWDTNEVRSYCSRCKGRTAQTPAGAKRLFSRLNDELLDDEVFRPGNVIHFLKRCPACYEPHESPIFALRVHTFDDEDEHPPDSELSGAFF